MKMQPAPSMLDQKAFSPTNKTRAEHLLASKRKDQALAQATVSILVQTWKFNPNINHYFSNLIKKDVNKQITWRELASIKRE